MWKWSGFYLSFVGFILRQSFSFRIWGEVFRSLRNGVWRGRSEKGWSIFFLAEAIDIFCMFIKCQERVNVWVER